jgi:cobalt-zinc-cadmium efflux system protein
VMNTVIAYWLRGDSHHSLNARAAYVHMAGDALSSLGVVLAGLAINYLGWTVADPLVSVLIAFFILYSSWGIIRDATNVLLEGTPKDLDVEALVAAMRDVPPVQDVHDLHIWTVSDGIHFLSSHVVLPDTCTLTQSAAVVAALNARLHDEFGIGHATIQTELADCDGCRADPQALYCGHMASHAHVGGCSH